MLMQARTLGRSEIEQRIPHQGAMCLLNAVLAWDADGITCEATSHRAADHPLRAHGRLGSACGVEYAAQAMALHGALVAQNESGAEGGARAPRSGYLAGVRGLELHVQRLDTVPGPLTVRAQRITGDDNTVLYMFSVDDGPRVLVSGRAVVVLDAARMPLRMTP